MLINGQEHSWSNAKVKINNQQLIGIKGIKYKEKEEMKNNYGAGNLPISRGYGKVTFEGSITLIKSEMVRLQDAAPNRRLQDIPEFDIIVSFIPRDGVGKIITETIHQCRFTENGTEMGIDDMEIVIENELLIGGITYA